MVLAPVAFAFARSKHLAFAVAVPIALAFLTETTFYILPGFEGALMFLRASIERSGSRLAVVAALAAASLLPYLILTIPQFLFNPVRCFTLVLLMSAVAGCFLLPAHPVRDIGFLVMLAAILLSGIFGRIYPSPDSKTPVFVLGHLTLIRSAVLSVLLLDRREHIRFGFIPSAREFRIGFGWATAAAAVALPLGLTLGVLHTGGHHVSVWIGIGEVLAFFWVVALSEEFFFRALLQRWIERWAGSDIIAITIASMVFGACHLYYGRQFPNTRFAILVGIAGFFYGAAFRQARSMRASMVTHALLVSAWRLFLH